MPTPINKRNQKNDASAWKIVAVSVVPAVAIIVAMLAFGYPVSKWISDAARSEFGELESAVSEPTQVAQPPQRVLHAAKTVHGSD